MFLCTYYKSHFSEGLENGFSTGAGSNAKVAGYVSGCVWQKVLHSDYICRAVGKHFDMIVSTVTRTSVCTLLHFKEIVHFSFSFGYRIETEINVNRVPWHHFNTKIIQ